MARSVNVDIDEAFVELSELYAFVDTKNAENTGNLDLPCHRGCSACCKESVFMTPLEFLYAWDYVQRELDDAQRESIVREGLRLYAVHQLLIEDLEGEHTPEHDVIAAQLKFVCPLLSAGGACLVYPQRELFARLFGSTFNSSGGVYGCGLVGSHLAGKEVTLLRASAMADRLRALPLTFKRQVYPYYIHWLYGEMNAAL
ncbi:MAG: hypothetical protein H7Z43_03255 [Clostridia bacterium]|nr:hypothetical protein [Deltaproteobacteria bacterium]